MTGWTLDRLLDGFAAGAPALPVTGLAMDSRAVEVGDAFVAVKGSAAHGLMHLPQALARGANAILWEPDTGVEAPQAQVPSIAVEKLGQRLGEISARFHGRPADRMFVAGVTGTDGKTSTAHLIAQAFETYGRACAYLGTLGNGRLGQLDAATHTTPNPIALHANLAAFLEQGIDACAMEVSSHALDQHRVGGVNFDAVVLTNLSRDHMDYHGTVENYANAKRRLFEAGDARTLILNRDDEYGAKWIAQIAQTAQKDQLCVYGIGGERPEHHAFVIGRELALTESGLSLTLETQTAQASLSSPLLGAFNAYNLLAAAAVLLSAGLSLDECATALQVATTVPGRIEAFCGREDQPLVVVDYAHTPRALEQVIAAVRAHVQGEVWCVFGCGGDRDRGKRALMGHAASLAADHVVITDDNPRSESPQAIVKDIMSGVVDAHRERVQIEHDRNAAIAHAISLAKKGDVVLVAGKGHETVQISASGTRPFSDRARVAELLGVSA